MKTILSFAIIVILVLSGLGAVAQDEIESTQTIVESITFSEPVIKDKEQYVSIELECATSQSMGSGKPALPVVSKTYMFPFGTRIEHVDVVFSDTYEQILTKDVMPAMVPQYISTEIEKQASLYVKAYNREMVHPESRFSYRTGAGLNNQQHVIYLTVHYRPITYSASEKVLSISGGATIEISYKLPSGPLNAPDEYDLLILAPADFEDELQPLVDYKNENEVATTIVTLDEIPSQGDDVQEDIKYFIKDSYENWGIDYVLLVGAGQRDAELFPVRYAWIGSGGYEDKFPSDLYYADFYDGEMGFSTWDADEDGKYGEFPDDIEAVDVYPDVAIGRLPCNDENEVTDIVNKIINFIHHNQVMEQIVQIGGDTFPGDPEDINEGEYANEDVLSRLPGYESTRLWGSNGKLKKLNIFLEISRGTDFVDFSGHGSHLSYATHPPGDDSVWIPDQTFYSPYTGFLYYEVGFLFNSNKKLPVFFFNACSCSKFSESPNCLSWAPLQKAKGGGIASFGASGIGYGSYGSSETARLFGWMEVHTFEVLYNIKGLGDTWGDCITNYANSFALEELDYKTMFEYTLFGDPSMAIETGPEPDSVNVPNMPFLHLFERILERLLSFPFLSRLFDL